VNAAAAALVLVGSVLIAGPALAAPAPSHWEVSVVSDLDPPVSGQTVELTGYLMSDSGAVAGRSATLLTRTVGSGDPFAPVATVTTDADGRAVAEVKLVRNTAYRWHFTGDAEYAKSSTTTLIQLIASKVVAHANGTLFRVGNVVVAFGAGYPDKAGNIVRLWMGEIPHPLVHQPAPVLLSAGRVRPDGKFHLTRSFSAKGWKKLFVEIDGDSVNGRGFSNYVAVQVR
jgi:hypothetical protein